MRDERDDVLPSIAQRWHLEVNHPEAVHQVLAELPRSNQLGEVPGRRRNHANVDPRGMALGANGLNLAVLEEAQQHRLHAQAHLADFVEENRAAVSDLQLPWLVAIGAGKTAFDVPEQFRLEERIGQGGAIDGDEGTRVASRVRVDMTGDEILADAALTSNQDLGIAAGHAPHERENLAHLRAGVHDRRCLAGAGVVFHRRLGRRFVSHERLHGRSSRRRRPAQERANRLVGSRQPGLQQGGCPSQPEIEVQRQPRGFPEKIRVFEAV